MSLEDSLAEVERLQEAQKPYYRPIWTKDDVVKFCCLQPFDEPDYDANRYLTEEKFETEEAARQWYIRHGFNAVTATLGRLMGILPEREND